MSSVISVENISYYASGRTILKDINLSIDRGDVCALIGANGAGKTTLLDVILNDIKPSVGKVVFDENITSKLKNTGVVYDHLPFFDLLTVGETIDYFRTLYKRKKGEIPSYYYEVLGLSKIKNLRLCKLSRGEMKKVSIFLGVFHNPSLMILDEPFANIDPTMIDSIWKVLKENSRTIFFTTHNWKDVENVANQVIFLHNGEIMLEKTPIEKVKEMLPQKNKIVTDYQESIVQGLDKYSYYLHDSLIHIFHDGNEDLTRLVATKTANFSFKACDIKDVYLYKTQEHA